MIQHVKDNWLWYLITVGLALIIIWAIGRYLKEIPPPPQDTFYYKVIDGAGNESCNHDSGIRPSKTPENTILRLQVLKREYNDGKPTDLATPTTIKLGMHYNDLKWSLTPQDIQDAGVYYIVDVIAPKNPFYGMNIQSPTDLREEILPEEDVEKSTKIP